MKTVASITAIATMFGSLIAAEKYSPDLLSINLLPLESMSKLCAADSGYKLYPYTDMPSEDELNALCKSEACCNMLDEANALDCVLTINGSEHTIQDSAAAIFAGCEILDAMELSG
ncbi:Elicitin [Phytophthora infestans]|uniref:Elicitin n=1 Tax=Phytophthora infestans TaxID=4787 RepID=A0A8S9UDE8_PHYIN|nr:Elicitin [Phytophthora infestans]